MPSYATYAFHAMDFSSIREPSYVCMVGTYIDRVRMTGELRWRRGELFSAKRMLRLGVIIRYLPDFVWENAPLHLERQMQRRMSSTARANERMNLQRGESIN